MIKEKKRSLKLKKIPSREELYAIYLREQIAKSKEEIRRGEVITIEELKEFIDGLGARYEDKHT